MKERVSSEACPPHAQHYSYVVLKKKGGRFEKEGWARREERLRPPSELLRSRRLSLEVAEHDVARLVVHFGLEYKLVFQRDRPRCRRPCRDLVDQAFDIGEFCISL